MSLAPHAEHHFTAVAVVRDLVIGISDGLTVPFALAAGLSGVIASNNLIVIAGLAEITAGAIAMGLGGYLAAKSDIQHYISEHKREFEEVREKPEEEVREIQAIFQEYGLTDNEIAPIIKALQARPRDWVNFMMRFELGMERPRPRRAWESAITIGGAYIAGGIIPLSSYMLVPSVHQAFLLSVFITAIALFAFGYAKGKFISIKPARSAWQTLLVGGLAAGAAYAIARVVSICSTQI